MRLTPRDEAVRIMRKNHIYLWIVPSRSRTGVLGYTIIGIGPYRRGHGDMWMYARDRGNVLDLTRRALAEMQTK